jgi:hypothetical protein
MMPVFGFIGKFQPFLGELEPSDLANGVFRWVRRTEGTPANMLPAFVRFQAKRIVVRTAACLADTSPTARRGCT